MKRSSLNLLHQILESPNRGDYGFVKRVSVDAGSQIALRYASDDPAKAEAPTFDASTGTSKFRITTCHKDREGDIVNPPGCLATLASYRANPTVFFAHESRKVPIGSAVDASGNFGVVVEQDYADSWVRFHGKSLESDQVAQFVEAKELRGASIGFRPIKAVVIRPPKMKRDHNNDDEDRDDEIDFTRRYGLHFKEWELYEWSVVPVPCNPECVAIRLQKGFGGKAISPLLADSLRPYVAEWEKTKPTIVGGVIPLSVEKESPTVPPSAPAPGMTPTPSENPDPNVAAEQRHRELVAHISKGHQMSHENHCCTRSHLEEHMKLHQKIAGDIADIHHKLAGHETVLNEIKLHLSKIASHLEQPKANTPTVDPVTSALASTLPVIAAQLKQTMSELRLMTGKID